MPFNLNEFRNKLLHGGARPSQFEMRLTWPDAVRGAANVAAAERDFSFLCEVAAIPASEMTTLGVMYFGRTLKYAGDRSYKDLSVNIINDEDFKVRNALETWSKAIQGYDTTTSIFDGGNAGGSYATDGVVVQYSRNVNGRNGAPIQAYKFVGMFPTSIGEVKLDWNTVDEVEKFSVTFAYQWWERIDAASGVAI